MKPPEKTLTNDEYRKLQREGLEKMIERKKINQTNSQCCQGGQLEAQRRKRRYMEGLLHAAGVPAEGWATQPQAFRRHGLGHGPRRALTAGREAQAPAGGKGKGEGAGGGGEGRGKGKGAGGGGKGKGKGGGGKGAGVGSR